MKQLQKQTIRKFSAEMRLEAKQLPSRLGSGCRSCGRNHVECLMHVVHDVRSSICSACMQNYAGKHASMYSYRGGWIMTHGAMLMAAET